jgi:regulator of sirC expression with transglutaminase-like and TPR domain
MSAIHDYFAQTTYSLPDHVSESTFSALLQLTEDPDQSVQQAILQQLQDYGTDILPALRYHVQFGSEECRQVLRAAISFHREAALKSLLSFISTATLIERVSTDSATFEQMLCHFSCFGFPEISKELITKELDQLALRIHADFVRKSIPTELDLLMSLNKVFFEEERYYGSEHDYHNPYNSFIAHVIGRKTGLPITLSSLYLLLGDRIDATLEGISMPMHFLVYHPEINRYIDVFHGGIFLSEQDCREFLERAGIRFQSTLLQPVTTRDVLARMTTNIGVSYRQENDTWGAEAAQRILTTLANTSNS